MALSTEFSPLYHICDARKTKVIIHLMKKLIYRVKHYSVNKQERVIQSLV